jgi:hypothetical protein
MSRLISIVTLAVMLLPLMGSARTISDFFASEPGKIFPLLTRTHRLDMVDYYNSGQDVDMVNNLEGVSKFRDLDSTYLMVATSGGKTVEMLLLTSGKDSLIAVIETAKLPVCDSRISFWTTDWQPARNGDKMFKMPTIDDFIVREMPRELRLDLQDAMIFPVIELTFTGDDFDTLVAAHKMKEFLAPDEYARFEPYLKPCIYYRINGTKKFKPAKQ